VRGINNGTGGAGIGVYGSHAGAGTGVYGTSISGYGVHGSSTSGTGVYGVTTDTTLATAGVYGISNGNGGQGVFGYASQTSGNSNGVLGLSNSTTGTGVYGYATQTTGVNYGVYGKTNSENDGFAGYFFGKVHVAGTLSKSAGSFRIDHPLDPANKYLVHSFVESPDMMNVYNGNVTTDERGMAEVILPNWFEALNKDYRYQLTVIGQFAQAIVAQEIKDNRFAILTDKPNVKVSWQVTGIRRDPYAERYRLPVEEEKLPEHQGKYLHPELYGQPREAGIHAKP
jgi:hypothetical protein